MKVISRVVFIACPVYTIRRPCFRINVVKQFHDPVYSLFGLTLSSCIWVLVKFSTVDTIAAKGAQEIPAKKLRGSHPGVALYNSRKYAYWMKVVVLRIDKDIRGGPTPLYNAGRPSLRTISFPTDRIDWRPCDDDNDPVWNRVFIRSRG